MESNNTFTTTTAATTTSMQPCITEVASPIMTTRRLAGHPPTETSVMPDSPIDGATSPFRGYPATLDSLPCQFQGPRSTAQAVVEIHVPQGIRSSDLPTSLPTQNTLHSVAYDLAVGETYKRSNITTGEPERRHYNVFYRI